MYVCIKWNGGGAGGVATLRGELQLDMFISAVFSHALGRGGKLWRQEEGGRARRERGVMDNVERG